MSRATVLLELSDDDFARLLAGTETIGRGDALAPGGLETGPTLAYLRALAARLERDWFRAAWAMLAAHEIVGLVGFKGPPNAEGEVEIGYGVAASRRRRGHATAAVARVIELAARRDDVRAILAETVFDNHASQRVLERNGFARTGTRLDPEDGELILWRRAIAR